MNHSGKKVPVFSSEKGTGRGLQPLTDFMNKYNHWSGGDEFTTYVAVPQCVTNYNRSIFLENTEYSVFDFTQFNIVRTPCTLLYSYTTQPDCVAKRGQSIIYR